ncbi:MAG: flagellar hook-basal body protein [Eubacteriales bacterium]|nr:flagellar hook-basal body protein [Eubacteriales bacterium]MDD4390113.1 flagellar hook-basal body protein [Eubacteriales bacterium]
MIRGFYSATSSLINQQTNLNVIANNMANINTVGFKPQRTAFATALYQQQYGGAGSTISVGNGIKVAQLSMDLTQASSQRTNMQMDFAITGEGFFALESEEGENLTYTRDGSFKIKMDGDEAYVVNASGNYVLDEEGDRIQLEKEIVVIREGEVEIETETESWNMNAIKPGVWTFANPYELKLLGGNQFEATELSGEAQEPEEGQSAVVLRGFLENSQVELYNEMVKMIEASKSFSFGAKLIQTADELEKTINQLRQ